MLSRGAGIERCSAKGGGFASLCTGGASRFGVATQRRAQSRVRKKALRRPPPRSRQRRVAGDATRHVVVVVAAIVALVRHLERRRRRRRHGELRKRCAASLQQGAAAALQVPHGARLQPRKGGVGGELQRRQLRVNLGLDALEIPAADGGGGG